MRVFQQFSRFRLGKEYSTEHHFLQHDEVGQGTDVLVTLAGELGKP
jgi:hypothetical protein